MIEKKKNINIVGKVSRERKIKEKENIQNVIYNHFDYLPKDIQDSIKKLEYPKSEMEIKLIDFANKETSNLMQELGIDSYNIPAENIHILPPEAYKYIDNKNRPAVNMPIYHSIFMNVMEFKYDLLYFGLAVFHEFLHLKSYYALELNKKDKELEENDENIIKTIYRSGMEIISLQKHGYSGKFHYHFRGLDEAIIGETEKMFFSKLLEMPDFKEYKEKLNDEKFLEKRKKISKKFNIPENDIYWISEDEKKYHCFSYPWNREVLKYICREIQKEFPEEYQTPNDVYKEFLKSFFNGNMIKIGKLIEKAFGFNSFRLISNMDDTNSSAVLTLESLKKLRIKKLKK